MLIVAYFGSSLNLELDDSTSTKSPVSSFGVNCNTVLGKITSAIGLLIISTGNSVTLIRYCVGLVNVNSIRVVSFNFNGDDFNIRNSGTM